MLKRSRVADTHSKRRWDHESHTRSFAGRNRTESRDYTLCQEGSAKLTDDNGQIA